MGDWVDLREDLEVVGLSPSGVKPQSSRHFIEWFVRYVTYQRISAVSVWKSTTYAVATAQKTDLRDAEHKSEPLLRRGSWKQKFLSLGP